MRDKKIIILITLGILAAASIIYGMTAKVGGKQRGVPVQENLLKKKDDIAKSESAASRMKRHARRTNFHSWRRSPFVPKGTPGTPHSNLTLSGILANGNDLKAMIGDSVVGKGDKIEGNTVVEVRKDRVILNDGAQDFELNLEQ